MSALRGAAAGDPPEDERLADGGAGLVAGAVKAADDLAGRVEPRNRPALREHAHCAIHHQSAVGGEQVTDVDVAEAVRTTVENVERDRPDSDADVQVKSIPAGPVRLKANAFRRLLANLISNAVRYGHKVEISGEIKDQRLWIYVDDNGPGIPADKREEAFRPFVRLDNARNLDETGTGLGLAIALDIAHAHGGEIMLEDAPMGGLRAAVKLPV